MATSIGPKIGIDGEAEYRKQINNIIQQQKTLATEMKAVSSAFDKNTTAEEKAQKQGKVLDNQIENQKKYLKQLEEQLKQCSDKYGENDSKTLKWKEAVNNANTELNKMRSESKNLAESVEKVGKEEDTTSSKTLSFGDVLGANLINDAIVGGLRRIADGIKQVGSEIKDTIMEASEYGDSIDKTSQKVGLSYDAFQKWDYVMNISGTSMSECTAGMKTFTNAIDDANGGTKSAVEKFNRLGISIDDLKGKSREDIFSMTIYALQNVQDETEKAAIANDLFGKSGQNLSAMLNMSNSATKDLIKNCEEYGMVMSDDAVKASAEFTDSLTNLKSTLRGTFYEAAGTVMPSLTKSMDKLTVIAKDKLAPAVAKVTERFVEWLDGIDFDEVFDDIGDGFEYVIKYGPVVAKTIGAIVAAFAVNKTVTGITSVVTSLKSLKDFSLTANAASVLGLSAAVGQLVGAFIDYKTNAMQIEPVTKSLSQHDQAIIDKNNELVSTYKNVMSARDESAATIIAEQNQLADEWEELQSIVDANGKVKEGYEGRANVITSDLSNAYGIEIDMTDGVISKYDDLKKSLDNLIQTKKAEALLDVNKEAYTTAIQNQQSALDNLLTTQKAYTEAQKSANKVFADISAAEKDMAYWQEKMNDELENGTYGSYQIVEAKYLEAEATRDAAVAQKANIGNVNDLRIAYNEASETYSGYMGVIENYEGLMAAVAEGDVDALNTAITNLSYGLQTASNSDKKQLTAQYENFKKMYDQMKSAVNVQGSGVTQAQVNEMKKLVDRSKQELDKLPSAASSTGQKTGSNFVGGVASGGNSSSLVAKQIGGNVISGLNVNGQAYSIGQNVSTGFGNGMSSKMNEVKAKTDTFANSILTKLRSVFNIHSPSRETYKIGDFVGQGLGLGMENQLDNIKKQAAELGQTAMTSLQMSTGSLSANSYAYNAGGINVTVNGGSTQNVDQLATLISQKINNEVRRKVGAFT